MCDVKHCIVDLLVPTAQLLMSSELWRLQSRRTSRICANRGMYAGHLSLSVSLHAHSTYLSSPTKQAGDHTRPVVEFHIMGALPDGRRAVVLRKL